MIDVIKTKSDRGFFMLLQHYRVFGTDGPMDKQAALRSILTDLLHLANTDELHWQQAVDGAVEDYLNDIEEAKKHD